MCRGPAAECSGSAIGFAAGSRSPRCAPRGGIHAVLDRRRAVTRMNRLVRLYRSAKRSTKRCVRHQPIASCSRDSQDSDGRLDADDAHGQCRRSAGVGSIGFIRGKTARTGRAGHETHPPAVVDSSINVCRSQKSSTAMVGPSSAVYRECARAMSRRAGMWSRLMCTVPHRRQRSSENKCN